MKRAATVTTLASVLTALGAVTPIASVGISQPMQSPGSAEGRPQTLLELSGTWSGSDWGNVVLAADGSGSYSDTFHTGPGRLRLRRVGRGRYVGTWGESSRRFGTLALALSPDGQRLIGRWTPDPRSTLGSRTGGTIVWTREGASSSERPEPPR